MNITHFRYAIEVANVGSISRAAENLFMSQPNLSKAIKELENSIGFLIFDRNTKGITVTEQGEQFLKYARNLINQMDTIENLFNPERADKQRLAVSAPRVFYPAYVLTKFVAQYPLESQPNIHFTETNGENIIKNIISGESKIGIYRYPKSQTSYLNDYLADKNIIMKPFFSFKHRVTLCADNKLAKKAEVSYADLKDYTEIVYRDDSNFFTKQKIKSGTNHNQKLLYISQRATFIDLINSGFDGFCWNSPVPREIAEKYNIAQIPCSESNVEYGDTFIYDKNFRISDNYKLFCDMIRKMAEELETY